MKRTIFNLLVCALSALVIMSCEKETPVRPERALDHYIELDFFSRYPGATLTDFSEYEDSRDGKTVTDIHYALSAVDFPEGHFYGLTFGSELNWTMFYSKAE